MVAGITPAQPLVIVQRNLPASQEDRMIRFRDRMARGQSREGWLDSRHTFSFADYREPGTHGLSEPSGHQ